MKLSDLLACLTQKQIIQPLSDGLKVRSIVQDSRKVNIDDLFVAIVGEKTDGHNHISEAIERGAIAIVAERYIPQKADVPYVITPDSRTALATLAAAQNQFPSRKLRVVGVTGTDGKTTTSTLIQAILTTDGHRTGMITTLGVMIDDVFFDTGVNTTTPDAIQIQHYLSKMEHMGIAYAVIETTSHALTQRRVHGCNYDVAAITNITPEHLDYHGTFEAYREAKEMLFHHLYQDSYRKQDTPKVSVLNADDSSFSRFASIPADTILTYGLINCADFSATNIMYTKQGTSFTAITPKGEMGIEMALVGEHNVYNALAAIAIAYSQKASFDAIQDGIASVERVCARMERIEYGQDFDVFVDYAHTPHAMEKVLQSAQRLTDQRVIVVAGLSGGLRDKTKRPLFGRTIGRLADKIVITSMDWFEEDVGSIMDQISIGVEEENRQKDTDYWCIRDRKEGITFGINLAQPNDVLVIAGKAHEDSIFYKGTEYPWNEFQIIQEAIETRLQGSLC